LYSNNEIASIFYNTNLCFLNSHMNFSVLQGTNTKLVFLSIIYTKLLSFIIKIII